MKRVLTAVVLIPLVLLVVFVGPYWLLALFLALVAILTLREFLGITEAYGIKPVRWPAYVFSSVLIFLPALKDAVFVLEDPFKSPVPSLGIERMNEGFLLMAVLVGISIAVRSEMRMALPAAAVPVFGFLYVAAPLSLAETLRIQGKDSILMFILFTVWGGDTAAYYVGRAIGRHKLAPIVSPNKTWEGAIASVLASIAIALAVFHLYRSPYYAHSVAENFIHPALIGLFTNVAAQFGDLFESALKRGANVKDSGSLLPGHGGMLDRIDALLFAVPVAWYYATLTGFPHHPFPEYFLFK